MTARHLLVTNDFPPKVGGIQNYLWELWRRLPADSFSVYATPHPGAAAFDAEQSFPVERSPEPVLIPYPWLLERLRRLAAREHCELLMFDPAVPLGAIGPDVGLRYGLVLHGAEVTIPGRMPGSRQILARTLRSADLVVAAGNYPLHEAERCAGQRLPSVVVPPGVDTDRFRPLPEGSPRRKRLRADLNVDQNDLLLATVSRLVPRKGLDTLIRAIARYNEARLDSEPKIRTVIAGEGREHKRLLKLAQQQRVLVRFEGKVPDHRVVELYQAADLMAMPCNERWFGLEQEGFGIAFLEAAACGVPSIAGRSGGAHEAVEHGVSGLVVDKPLDVDDVAASLRRLALDSDLRTKMALEARSRAERLFTYDRLAGELAAALDNVADR